MKLTNDIVCKQKLRQEAILCFQKGMTVTPAIENNVIAALKQVGVTVIVSPFDADAQLTHLCVSGVCQAALTDDIDILIYSMISTHSFPILYNFENTGAVQVLSLQTIGLYFQSQTDLPATSSSFIKRKLSSSNQQSSSSNTNNTNETSNSSDSSDSPDSNELNVLSGNESTSFKDYFSGSQSPRLFLQMNLLIGCNFIQPIEGVDADIALQVIYSILSYILFIFLFIIDFNFNFQLTI